MNIRKLTRNDVDSAADIISKNHGVRWRPAAIRELRAMFGYGPIRPTYWVADDLGSVVGVAGYVQSWMDYGVYEVFWVNVVPPRQRQGIGRALVKRVLDEIAGKNEAYLVVLSAGACNVPYYERHFGFTRTVVRGPDRMTLMTMTVRGRPRVDCAETRLAG